MFFLYDENGGLYGFVKDEKKYFYIKDITGTILGIVNESGTLVGKYEYSAYGKCTILLDTDGIATINPFRFKCYYYDTESGMYYCQTRYFVPEWGRWLNADSPNFLQFDNINGMNLFAYCNNSPVMYADPSGCLLGLVLISLFLFATTTTGAVLSGVKAAKEGKKGTELFKSIVLGAGIGLAVGGATLALVGIGASLIGGVSATIFGVAAKTVFSIGAVAFDFTAFVIAPILGFSMQGIDWEPAEPLPLPNKPQPTPPHPYLKRTNNNKKTYFSLF